MKTILSALAALMLAGIAAAQSPATSETRFGEAARIFQRASAGEKGDVDAAIAVFETLVKEEPRHPVYAAYLGSAISLKGRDAWMPWNKLKFSEQGLDHVDKALATLKPEHDRLLLRGVAASLETRLVAASLFVKLPEGIFHRRAAGMKLLDELQKHPVFATAPAEFRAAVQRTVEAAKAAGS